MKKVFIGIDFSKLKFDVAIYNVQAKAIIATEVFENEQCGFDLFLKWIKENIRNKKSEILFCGEHTGYYSGNLSVFLYESGYDMWLVSGLEMKLTQGIKRSKTDRVDACKIAEYAFRYQDKALVFKPVSSALGEIRELLSYRERLVETRKVLTTSAREMKRVKDNASCDYIYQESIEYIKTLNRSILHCEKRIETLLKQDISLKNNYCLVSSVVGIGLVNAALILVSTSNFTLFDSPRKFGCYCGVVPFEHSSGTSVRGKTRVSKMANRKIKTKLTLAAQNAIRFDPELKEYYQRKREEGKNHWVVLNNVKNKLIHRIFAVVRDGQMYEKQYTHPLKQVA